MSFKIKVPAKCILAGEHLILERGYAIVTPFKQYYLTLSHEPNAIKTMHTISAEGHNSLGIILWPAICKAYELLEKDSSKITGFFNIKSTIAPCSGLGFSAALCVAVTEWLIFQELLPRSNLFQFAIQLEDMFHKQSSGVDVAGVTAQSIIKYFPNREIKEMSTTWQPLLYISSSNETSFTGPCVKKVLELKKENPSKAELIYEKMLQAVVLINLALEEQKEASLRILAEGLTIGNACFYDWGLVSSQLHDHIQLLKQHALACKIIGAGFGGHVVSLWDSPPPSDFPIKLCPLPLNVLKRE